MTRSMTGWRVWRLLAAALVSSLAGCTALTTQVLVNETGRPRPAGTVHCEGSEWTDNSLIALVPIPIISLAMPTQELNEIKTDDVLSACGPSDRLTNRQVEVNRAMCVPTVLTRVISLGVWQWCPAKVSWNADVMPPPTRAPAGGIPGEAPMEEAPRPYGSTPR
jgi:hypothetical protein